MDRRHTEGQICENILVEYLLRRDMYVFKPEASHSPVDVISISKEGKIYLFDAKKDARRYVPNRKAHKRIYRILTPFQKLLGVRMAYIDLDTRNVHIVPPLDPSRQTRLRNGQFGQQVKSTPKSKKP